MSVAVLALIEGDWVAPLHVAAGLDEAPGRLILLSDGSAEARWSYVAAQPASMVRIDKGAPEPFAHINTLLGKATLSSPEAPPFTGGLVGLASYDLTAPQGRGGDDPQHWPGLVLARYEAVLAFDHQEKRLIAVGRGVDADLADQAASRALEWVGQARHPAKASGSLTGAFEAERPAEAYGDAVSDVVRRIAAGEIFQANIARTWSGVLSPRACPFDLFVRLAATSPAPYAAFWDLGDHVLVSNSPEAFLSVRGDRIAAHPIKGTRARGSTPEQDEALKAELIISSKDRAENLMIVDLMRNDLSRVCVPGSVTVPRLFELRSFSNVHHLISTVEGRLEAGAGAAEVLTATFPPGSITGAPKHQAMKVIADHESARGPWCGSLFLAGHDGSLEASVLIRTVAFNRVREGWGYRTQAGAGIVADSDPVTELSETGAKIAAIRDALMQGGHA